MVVGVDVGGVAVLHPECSGVARASSPLCTGTHVIRAAARDAWTRHHAYRYAANMGGTHRRVYSELGAIFVHTQWGTPTS